MRVKIIYTQLSYILYIIVTSCTIFKDDLLTKSRKDQKGMKDYQKWEHQNKTVRRIWPSFNFNVITIIIILFRWLSWHRGIEPVLLRWLVGLISTPREIHFQAPQCLNINCCMLLPTVCWLLREANIK